MTPPDSPGPVRMIENEWIELPDGVRVAIRLWLPHDAESHPVSAILDSVPYRKSDGTAIGDAAWGTYFAAHGFAFARVDLRGSGDSTGLLEDEYSEQEQIDTERVIAWLAHRPWCTGAVGMIGISWGGFAALQLAARNPDHLRGVVPIHASDDRYADDVHYIGGCVSAMDMAQWATSMLAYLNQPPDPEVVGSAWRKLWLERMRRRQGLHRALAGSSTPRPLLAARVGLRGLQHDPVPRIRRRRVGRRLPRHGVARRRARPQSRARPHRPVEPHRSRVRRPRPGDRLPPGVRALLRRQPQRGRERVLRRAKADQLYAGGRRTGRLVRAAAGPVGGGPKLAVARSRALDLHDWCPGAGAGELSAGAVRDPERPQPPGHRCGQRGVVRRRQLGRLPARPARRRRRLAVLGHRASGRAGRAAGERRGGARGERRSARGGSSSCASATSPPTAPPR